MDQIKRIMRPTDVPDTGMLNIYKFESCFILYDNKLIACFKAFCVTFYGPTLTKMYKDGRKMIAESPLHLGLMLLANF